MVERRLTGRHYQTYLNPDRAIDEGARQVTGIEDEFLLDKPRFVDVVDEFLAFVDGAELVIHNASFDIGFLDAELAALVNARGRMIAVPMTGIASTELPRLFERFYRIEGAQGRSFEGSGIGLALVQELVKLHGGRIDVHSEPDKGSRFTISVPFGLAHLSTARMGAAAPLPAASRRGSAYANEALGWLPSHDDVSAETGPMPSAATAGRVVLADDNADMREYVARLLAAEGYAVETVVDGHKALLATRRELPDLILSDVMMPRRSPESQPGYRLGPDSWPPCAMIAQTPRLRYSHRAAFKASMRRSRARTCGFRPAPIDYPERAISARELIARVSSNIGLSRVRRQAAAGFVKAFPTRLRTTWKKPKPR
ncbi:MAG: hypothetical protein WDW38_006516 [Sanguina aurantia]